MRFICPEVDPSSKIKDLYKAYSIETEILDNSLNRIFLNVKNNVTNYFYAKPIMYKYLSSITESTAPMTIAEYAVYTGIPIAHNLGATIGAMDVYFQAAEVLKLKTEMFFTIFSETGIAFYKPERLAGSVEITNYQIIEKIKQEYSDYNFYGEAGNKITASVIQSDTINIATIDDDLKTIIINTNKAAADVIVIVTGYDAAILDYIKLGSAVYLVVSKKEENGLYRLFLVRENTGTYTFTGDDLTNPNVSTGGGSGVDSFNGRTGAVTPQNGDYTAANVGLGNVTNHAQLKAADLDTDGTLAANSDTKIPSQKAVKTYADTKQPAMSKASGAEVNTGTDDAKFVTAKAIEDSDIAFLSDIPVGVIADPITNPILSANLTIPNGDIYQQIDPFELGADTDLILGTDSVMIINPNVETECYKCEKQYIGGTTYNGVALNVTSTNGTLIRGVFIPYQLSDSTWRLRFNIVMTWSGSPTSATVAVAGITFRNTANYYQAVSISYQGAYNITQEYITPNTGNITWGLSGSGGLPIGLSGDVELESKPTWAD